MKIVTANLVPSRYAEIDHWDSKGQHTGGDGDWVEYVIRADFGGHKRYTVMYIGPGGTCRRETGGDILPGPYGALIGQPTVITSSPVAQPGRPAR